MTTVSQDLDRKRADALIRIGQNVVGTTLAGAVPTPALETAKMVGIATADAWMFWDLYKVYFNQSLSSKRLEELLGQAGIIIFTGGVVGYAVIKFSQSMISEALNAIPVLGWAVSGAMVGSSTLAVGLAWMMFLEERYRTSHALNDGEESVRIRPASERKRRVVVIQHEVPVNGTQNGVHAHVDKFHSGEVDSDDRVQALHPEGKRSVYVDRRKYEQIKDAMLDVIAAQNEVELQTLITAVKEKIPDFDGSVNWYVTTIKLDLEARGTIERVEGSTPQRLRIKS